MTSVSTSIHLYPEGVQGELYTTLTIGDVKVSALIDTGSGGLLTIEDVPHVVTYKKRPQVTTVTNVNTPLGLTCSLECTEQTLSPCFFPTDKTCELHFGTGDVMYNPVLESIALGSLQHPAFFMALAKTEENFPFPIACILGISHYKYADDSPLGSLCQSSKGHQVFINSNTTTFQLFQHLGGGNCLVDRQTIRLAYGPGDSTLSFGVPVPNSPNSVKVPMVLTMFPFYAVKLTAFQVGAVKVPLSKPFVFILDSGTSSGGTLAPEVHDALAAALQRYTNGLTGLSINDAKVQAVPRNKLYLFPPIAFTFGGFTHVLQPDTYMLPTDTTSSTSPNSLINVFSKGDDDVSIVGNVVFKNLALTFDLLQDEVHFESLIQPTPAIDPGYPSPGPATQAHTMSDSLLQGESVEVAKPVVRYGLPHGALRQKQFVVVDNLPTSFGAALKDNKCCLFDSVSKQNKAVQSLTPVLIKGNDVEGAKVTTPVNQNVWSTRNIVMLVAIGVMLALLIWSATRFAVRVQRAKVLQN